VLYVMSGEMPADPNVARAERGKQELDMFYPGLRSSPLQRPVMPDNNWYATQFLEDESCRLEPPCRVVEVNDVGFVKSFGKQSKTRWARQSSPRDRRDFLDAHLFRQLQSPTPPLPESCCDDRYLVTEGPSSGDLTNPDFASASIIQVEIGNDENTHCSR